MERKSVSLTVVQRPLTQRAGIMGRVNGAEKTGRMETSGESHRRRITMDKICPFTRGNKFLDSPCKTSECEWWVSEEKSCAVPLIARMLNEMMTGEPPKEVQE